MTAQHQSSPNPIQETSKLTDDTHSDYQQVKSTAQQSMQRGVWCERFDPRFVPFASRRMECDLPKQAIQSLSEGKHFLSYRGLPIAKNPLDMTLYQTLFYELQPQTIIELGAYTGASALWMADSLETFGCHTKIISVDIDLTLVDPLPRSQNSIEFRQGDCNHIESLFPASELQTLPHPLVVIDDAHVNVAGVYQHFHTHAFQSNDYLIVEDTVPWIPGTFGDADSAQEWGDWKFHEISDFFSQHPDQYLVDRYYTDFYGYNATWNWNGFLRRT